MSGKGWFDHALEQLEGGSSSKKPQTSDDQTSAKSILGGVVSQITGKSSDTGHGTTSNVAGANEAATKQAQQAANDDVVKELYGKSDDTKSHDRQVESEEDQSETQKAATEFIQEKIEEGKTPEEAQKLYALRKQLHNDYYQKLINYGKQHEAPEERTADKVEKEKEEDARMNLEEQKKKDTPIAVTMGANKAEQFPGASG